MERRNARLVVAFYPSLTTCTSLATSATLAAFILLATGSNAAVGIAVGIQGICNLLTALPAAALADHYGRIIVVRIAAFIGCCGLATIVLGAWRSQYWTVCAGLGIFGAFMGGHAGSMEAIFGDALASTDSETRTAWYARKASLRVLGNTAGPVASMLVFWRLGDHWRRSTLTVVLIVGASLFVLPFCLAMAITESHGRRQRRSTEETPSSWSHQRLLVARTIVCADLISMLGSGMTIKYFPLFFWRDCHFSPIATNAVYCGGPLGISIAANLAQKLSVKIGRVQTTLLCKSLGILLLCLLASLSQPYLIVPVYLLRTWLANCSSGLTRSILNEHVAPQHRAKWNAAESVNIFSWSGSAVLGGFIIERKGYRFTFRVTAAIQALSALVLLTLLLPDKKPHNHLVNPLLDLQPPLDQDEQDSPRSFVDDTLSPTATYDDGLPLNNRRIIEPPHSDDESGPAYRLLSPHSESDMSKTSSQCRNPFIDDEDNEYLEDGCDITTI